MSRRRLVEWQRDTRRYHAYVRQMSEIARAALVRRGLRLNYATIAYNTLEAIGSLIAGVLAGSVALVAFGIDSLIEVSASGVAQWRLRSDFDPTRRIRIERISARLIGWSFIALGAYVTIDSVKALWLREPPSPTVFGVVILALSVIVMPLLARAKATVAKGMQSSALRAEAKQTSLCAYLSGIALVGVLLNATFGWWWADPASALCMVPIIAKEGMEGLGKGISIKRS